MMSVIHLIREDKKQFSRVQNKPGIFKYLYHPDFKVALLYRLSCFCYQQKILRPFSYLFTMMNDFFHGVWIGPRVEIGPGVYFGHPRGLVINPSTKIGANCSILQQVTIGGPNVVIGDNVEINAGVKIVSNVRSEKQALAIGDNVIIGAGSVVINDIPSYSIAVGVPAKVVKSITIEENWINFRNLRNRRGY